jgi:hypothetical protein
MKISVIMGIFHMTIGIVMKGTNAAYHGHWVDLITEVIFGLVIFYGLFGWMDLMIISKWFTDLNIEDNTIDMDYYNKEWNLDLGSKYSAHHVQDPTTKEFYDPDPATFADKSVTYGNG